MDLPTSTAAGLNDEGHTSWRSSRGQRLKMLVPDGLPRKESDHRATTLILGTMQNVSTENLATMGLERTGPAWES